MKAFIVGAACILAATSASAQGLVFQERPICNGTPAAETDACKVELACGDWIDRLQHVQLGAYSLYTQLIIPEDAEYTSKQLRQFEQIRRYERSEDRLRRRLAKCEAKALA